MAKFQKGHKLAKGGKRDGAGRKSKAEKDALGAASLRLLAKLEAAADKVAHGYLQLAHGRNVKHYNQKTGQHIYTEFEVDSAVSRHFVDKFVPAAKQQLEISGGLKIVKVDAFDPSKVK